MIVLSFVDDFTDMFINMLYKFTEILFKQGKELKYSSSILMSF